MNLDWLEIREGSVRTYPNDDLAAHVIGNVDGEGKGAAGIELKLNKALAGTPGEVRIERDGKESSYASEVVKLATIGKNIGLTIDRELQFVAKEALKEAVVKNHADHGSLVAMDPEHGRSAGARELSDLRFERAFAAGRESRRTRRSGRGGSLRAGVGV